MMEEELLIYFLEHGAPLILIILQFPETDKNLTLNLYLVEIITENYFSGKSLPVEYLQAHCL